MIKSVKIEGVPAFEPGGGKLGPLTTVNFVFGPNGAGKTSVSRVISVPEQYPGSEVSWAGSSATEVRAFNKDYAQLTFGNEAGLNGVFVLGRESKQAQEERGVLSAESARLRGRIDSISTELGSADTGTGKRCALNLLRERMSATIWKEKSALDAALKPAFDGFHGSKSKLLEEVLERRDKSKCEDPHPEVSLVSRAATAFDEDSTTFDDVPQIAADPVRNALAADVWSKSIRGSSEVSVAELIDSLRNSDWVRDGLAYFSSSQGLCPFCQQSIPSEVAGHLQNYFDQTYAREVVSLERVAEALSAGLADALNRIVDTRPLVAPWIDPKDFDLAATALASAAAESDRIVQHKLNAPSSSLVFPDVPAQIELVNVAIRDANSTIANHNRVVRDRSAAMTMLTDDVWNYFVWDRLDAAVGVFLPEEATLKDEISKLVQEREQATDRLAEVHLRLKELAKAATSSEPTIDEINKMLRGAGFNNFSLAPSSDLADGYQVVREDGTVVEDTLSEGERSFVTFLYFLHDLRGLDSNLGRVPETVAVIDDPISSLDSSSLFFVSSQIRAIARDALLGVGTVRQLIVLTHNVYFHKEITYRPDFWKRANKALNKVSFHAIEKSLDGPNAIVAHDNNPISTAYDLLWAELRRAQDPPLMTVSIQNSMRRIVETYFGFAGDTGVSKIPDLLEGVEQTICQSLISWLHDGSHSTELLDAMHYSHVGDSPEVWFRIFKEIFEQSGHAAHHDMMLPAV